MEIVREVAQETQERQFVASPRILAMLEEYDLNFEIQKEALEGKESKRRTPYYGLYNSVTNQCISVVKSGYHVSQNDEVLDMVIRGTEIFGAELSIHTAGSINGGRQVFIQLAVQGESKVANDVLKRYITIIDSNDGTSALSVGMGDLTMSCMNQFFKFAKAGKKFRHSASLAEKLKSLPFQIESAMKDSYKQVKIYEELADFQVNENKKHFLVKEVLGYDRKLTSPEKYAELSSRSINIMDKLYAHIDKEIADKGQNMWGLHSGVTSFTTHDASAPKRDNGRLESLLMGKNYGLNQKSLNYVMRESGIYEEVA